MINLCLFIKIIRFIFPIFIDYSEIEFGGDFYTTPDHEETLYVRNLSANDFILYPLIEYAADSIDWDLNSIPPTPPSREHILGTDDQRQRCLCEIIIWLT